MSAEQSLLESENENRCSIETIHRNSIGLNSLTLVQLEMSRRFECERIIKSKIERRKTTNTSLVTFVCCCFYFVVRKPIDSNTIKNDLLFCVQFCNNIHIMLCILRVREKMMNWNEKTTTENEIAIPHKSTSHINVITL